MVAQQVFTYLVEARAGSKLLICSVCRVDLQWEFNISSSSEGLEISMLGMWRAENLTV